MTCGNAHGTDIDEIRKAVQERPPVVVKFNRSARTSVCPVCERTIAIEAGPILVLEDGGAPVCADHYAPYVDDVVEEYGMLQAARHWYPTSLPPVHAYYETLRAAIYRNPTGFYWPDRSHGFSGGHVLEEYPDDLDSPVVLVGQNLYRAEARRIDELMPLFRVEPAFEQSLASVLQRRASEDATWLTLDGLIWTSGQLLTALTTEQLALNVTWEPIEPAGYDSLVLWNGREQGPEGNPLVIDLPVHGDAREALKVVYGSHVSLPVIRLAELGDSPTLIRTDASRWQA